MIDGVSWESRICVGMFQNFVFDCSKEAEKEKNAYLGVYECEFTGSLCHTTNR